MRSVGLQRCSPSAFPTEECETGQVAEVVRPLLKIGAQLNSQRPFPLKGIPSREGQVMTMSTKTLEHLLVRLSPWFLFGFISPSGLSTRDYTHWNLCKIDIQICHGEQWQCLMQQDESIHQNGKWGLVNSLTKQFKTLWLYKPGILILQTKNSMHMYCCQACLLWYLGQKTGICIALATFSTESFYIILFQYKSKEVLRKHHSAQTLLAHCIFELNGNRCSR